MEQRCERTSSGGAFGFVLRWQNGLDNSVSARETWAPPFLSMDHKWVSEPRAQSGPTPESSVFIWDLLFGPIQIVLFFFFLFLFPTFLDVFTSMKIFKVVDQ